MTASARQRPARVVPPPRDPASGACAVHVREWTDAGSWEAFVLAAGDANVAHRWAWTQVVPQAYGHRVVPLAAVRDGRLVGVLPLVQVRSRVFGRALVSMPYLDSGGLCTDGDTEAGYALLAAALDLADDGGTRLELRHLGPRDIGLPASTHKVTMTVDLTGGEDAVWAGARPNRRGQVRKARRSGLEAVTCGADGLGDFYRVLAHNMRDLGSPVHRRRFFAAVSGELGADATYVLVRSGPDVVGAGLVLVHGRRAVLPWSSSLRAALALAPNQLLYWEVARYAIARGCTVLDLGRSSPGSGTFEAKREWGAGQVQLCWHRTGGRQDGAGAEGEGGDDPGRRLAWATRLWSRLPVPVATAAGSAIRGGLPQ
jgi:FemAB-related protein (PEP-CTERM system-associated)